MGIPFFDAENAAPMDEVVAVFKESDISIKKIVLLETLGLLYSDGVFDDSENSIIIISRKENRLFSTLKKACFTYTFY